MSGKSEQSAPDLRTASRADVPNNRCPARGVVHTTRGLVPLSLINARVTAGRSAKVSPPAEFLIVVDAVSEVWTIFSSHA
ncbi:hypothetical protein [Halobellus rubicundus]|uniref:Uncharacterized protein n=1 Tax=Halobellus rubicundus TaxID=2996466 RepID=A0ABD5M6Y4_9EURY